CLEIFRRAGLCLEGLDRLATVQTLAEIVRSAEILREALTETLPIFGGHAFRALVQDRLDFLLCCLLVALLLCCRRKYQAACKQQSGGSGPPPPRTKHESSPRRAHGRCSFQWACLREVQDISKWTLTKLNGKPRCSRDARYPKHHVFLAGQPCCVAER